MAILPRGFLRFSLYLRLREFTKMKKSLLSLVAMLGLTTAAMAQAPTINVPKEQKNIKVSATTYVLKDKTLTPSRRAESYSNWYNFTGAYEENELLGQTLSGFVNFIQPDTNLYMVYSDGTKAKLGFHIVGTSFDPKDSNFLNKAEVLTRFNPYTVDSLAFTQFYIRQADKVNIGGNMVDIVDTVYIQYFNITGIKVGGYTLQSNPGVTYRYATPAIDKLSYKSLLNSTAIKTDTLFLTKDFADSVVTENGVPKSFFGRAIQIPVNVTTKSTNGADGTTNLFAFSVVYKPMVKAALGDTGMAYNGSTWFKKYNMYGVRLASLDGHDQNITSTNKINNMFVTNFQVRYGQTLFGFLKSYLPGTVFGNTIFFPSFLHLTTPNLTTKNIVAGLSGVQVYPNPVSSNASVDVVFDLTAPSAVKAVVTDLNGRVVATSASINCIAGQNAVSVSTQGLSKGIYMVTVESNLGRMSSKLTVN
jgi:hypothetical protein